MRSNWSTESRHKRGYGTAWDKIRPVIIARDQGLCQPCLRKGMVQPGRIVDHKVPKFKGGTDDHDNLEYVCKDCSDEKTAKESAEAQGRTYRPRQEIGADGWPKL